MNLSKAVLVLHTNEMLHNNTLILLFRFSETRQPAKPMVTF